MSSNLNSRVLQFEKDVGIAHDIIHGDAQTTVQTDGGPVRSIAKLIADADARIDAATDEGLLSVSLAAAGGAGLIEFDGGTVQDALESIKTLATYADLRAYAGRAVGVRIVASGIAGDFRRDDTDTATADDGGIVIVDGRDRRWKRIFDGSASVRWFGAAADGVTNDAAALTAAIATPWGAIVPAGTTVYASVTAQQALTVLPSLGKLVANGSLQIELPQAWMNFAAPLSLGTKALHNVTISGAEFAVYALDDAEPTIVATALSPTRYAYDVTVPMPSTVGIEVGDLVRVSPAHYAVNSSTPPASADLTLRGGRNYEIGGSHLVTAVTADSVIYRVHSRNSSDSFPTPFQAALLPGSVMARVPTVLNFTAETSGLIAEGSIGLVRRLGVVGLSTGTLTRGISAEVIASGVRASDRTVCLNDISVHGFSAEGVLMQGPNLQFISRNLHVSKSGSHGLSIHTCTADAANTCVNGAGHTVGNGIVAFNAASVRCANSIAVGCRNSGFYSNRGSSMAAEFCVSMGHGNYQEEVAGAFKDLEGKGFESEAAATMFCNDSIAGFCTTMGFYANAASVLAGYRCISSNHKLRHGFYATLGATMAARLGIAVGNGGMGFYAYTAGRMEALNTYASGNGQQDYRSQQGGIIVAQGFKRPGSTFAPPVDSIVAGSTIITTNALTGPATNVYGGILVASATGSITVQESYSFYSVDTYAGAATGTLKTITGGYNGQVIVLRTLTGSRKTTISNSAGNIRLKVGVDLAMNAIAQKVELIYDLNGDQWFEL